MPDLAGRFQALGAALAGNAPIWREQPFYRQQPDWTTRLPALAQACLRLDDAEVETLAGDNARLLAWVAGHAPEWRGLAELAQLPRHAGLAVADTGRESWHVPGRKQAQIEAFAAAVAPPRAPVLEWCSGKGHLGRLLGKRWRLPVYSLERDPALVDAGAELATRAGVEQAFIAADALAPDAARHLAGRHVVALHACGELHRTVARLAAVTQVPALDLAPCCYYRGADAGYVPFHPNGPPLNAADLHLAVTETATAGARGRRLRDRAMARKLGFLAWHREHTGLERPARFPPVPEAWNGLDFAEYGRRLAARAGLTPAVDIDWRVYERLGEQRRGEVMRLSLARLAFRRPLELWLALDLALYLEEHGYRVKVAEFCAPSLTPRNLLISARL